MVQIFGHESNFEKKSLSKNAPSTRILYASRATFVLQNTFYYNVIISK